MAMYWSTDEYDGRSPMDRWLDASFQLEMPTSSQQSNPEQMQRQLWQHQMQCMTQNLMALNPSPQQQNQQQQQQPQQQQQQQQHLQQHQTPSQQRFYVVPMQGSLGLPLKQTTREERSAAELAAAAANVESLRVQALSGKTAPWGVNVQNASLSGPPSSRDEVPPWYDDRLTCFIPDPSIVKSQQQSLLSSMLASGVSFGRKISDGTSSVRSTPGQANLPVEQHGVAVATSASRRRRRQRASAHAKQVAASEQATQQNQTQLDYPSQDGPDEGGQTETACCNSLHSQLSSTSPEVVSAALLQMHRRIRQLTLDAQGCRIVQLALQVAGPKEAADLASELHGFVRRALSSPHGNYVVQKVVTELPPKLAVFVVEELLGLAVDVARHRYGCRVLCRVLEHAAEHPLTIELVDELLKEAVELSRHNFGHHVIQSVLEHGLPDHKHKVADSLLHDITRNAKNRNATYVIERALTYCSEADQRLFAAALLADPRELVSLAENQFGFHVVRALLRLPGECAAPARSLLQSVAPKLQVDKYGSRVMEELRLHGAAQAA